MHKHVDADDDELEDNQWIHVLHEQDHYPSITKIVNGQYELAKRMMGWFCHLMMIM